MATTGYFYVYRLSGFGKAARYTLVQGPVLPPDPSMSTFGATVSLTKNGNTLAVGAVPATGKVCSYE